MTSTTFFIIFIPILSILLLTINLLLAPHFPYQEKDSAFECGFHSFLGQNRTQFSISFFIFGLLFLLFDLEIILVYPYSVSGYNNDGYGLTIVILFFTILALGFIFELGKNALSIDSKQTFLPDNNNTQTLDVFITDLDMESPKFTSLPLQAGVSLFKLGKKPATTMFKFITIIFIYIKAFLWLHSPILCEAPDAWVKHFEVESETLHLYQPKPDFCTPEIKKIDQSWFTDKSPIRDFIYEWLEKSKVQYQTKIYNQEAYLDRCISKAKGFLESNTAGIYQESPIHEHMTNNTLQDGVFDLGVLSFALFFLQLKKSGLLYIIILAL